MAVLNSMTTKHIYLFISFVLTIKRIYFIYFNVHFPRTQTEKAAVCPVHILVATNNSADHYSLFIL